MPFRKVEALIAELKVTKKKLLIAELQLASMKIDLNNARFNEKKLKLALDKVFKSVSNGVGNNE